MFRADKVGAGCYSRTVGDNVASVDSDDTSVVGADCSVCPVRHRECITAQWKYGAVCRY